MIFRNIIMDNWGNLLYMEGGQPYVKKRWKIIAKKIAKENNCPLLLGSATPDLVTYYKANQEKITLL